MSENQDLVERLQKIRKTTGHSESESDEKPNSSTEDSCGLENAVKVEDPSQDAHVTAMKPTKSVSADQTAPTNDQHVNGSTEKEQVADDDSGKVVITDLIANVRGGIPCDIFYINDQTGKLQIFKTFDQLSEYVVQASCSSNGKINEAIGVDDEVISTVISIPLGSMTHHVAMGTYLRHLYEKDKLMDVSIDIEDETFKAHRIALSCYSKYFSNLFNSIKFTQVPVTFRVKGTSKESFAAFLEFVYTGQVSILHYFAVDFLNMVEKFGVPTLKKKYTDIIESLPGKYVVQILLKYTEGPICNLAFKRAEEEFMNMATVDGVLDIGVELMCRLIESDRLVVDTEYKVFQFALRYIAHNLEDRVKYASRLFGLVRFTCMTQVELFMCSETTGLVRDYEKVREQLLIANWVLTSDKLNKDECFRYVRQPPRLSYSHRLPAAYFNDKNNAANYRNKPNISPDCVRMPPPLMTSTPKPSSSQKYAKPVIVPEQMQTLAGFAPETVDIFVIGGFQEESSSDKKARTVERYNADDNAWDFFCSLKEPRRYHTVVILNRQLYVLGGCSPDDETNPSSSVCTMDFNTKQWTTMADMNDPRQQHCACVLGGKIYVMGGKGTGECVLETMECYNPDTNTWNYVAPLQVPVYAASAAVLHDRIYIVGGITQTKDHFSKSDISPCVASYDPRTNSWTFHSDLRFPRCRADLVNVGGRLFLCGGATFACNRYASRFISLSSIDEYIEKHDMWCHLTDLIIPRHDVGIAVAGSRIYVVGGISSTADRVLQSIECFDTFRCTWLSGVQDLPYPTRWLKCASVNTAWQAIKRSTQPQ